MRQSRWKNLYLQVLVAIVIGIVLGVFDPGLAEAMKPLGDGFIKLVKMIIGPVIFLTVVVGIARMGDLRQVGRIGVKALIYFEILTTLALIIGLVVANTVKPGTGMNVDPTTLDGGGIAAYRQAATSMQRAREAYEAELEAAGEPGLVRTAVVDPQGRFDLGRLPAGRWLIIATSESFHETSAPRAERKDREMYSPRPRLVGFHTRAVWLRDVAVAAEPVELELTDRNIWFTGVVEQRVVDPVPGRR